jgi:DNA-binding transcriptional MerR regulator
MELQMTKGENLRLVDQSLGSHQAKTKIIRRGRYHDMAVKEIKQQREESKEVIARSLALELKLNELETIITELTQNQLICTGNIERKSVWQRTVRLNKPLTPDERNLVRRTKSKCIQIPITKSEIARIAGKLDRLPAEAP